MRLRGRRRPAGMERVPTEVLKPELVLGPLGPVVLRLGPGRGLLDYPGGRSCDAIANVWPTDEAWGEALWPFDSRYGWFVVPIDLRLGHIVEFRQEASSVFGCVVESALSWTLVMIEPDRDSAHRRASLVVEIQYRLERGTLF